MGRRKKFKTDEERHEARKLARRAYYARNVEREKEKARERWQARQKAKKHVKAAAVVEQLVLPHTTKFLGPGHYIHSTTVLYELLVCLVEDFKTWYDGNVENEWDIWVKITTHLITLQQRGKTDSQFLTTIRAKSQIAAAVNDVAQEGEIEAVTRLADPDDWDELCTAFQQLSSSATRLKSCIDELFLFFEAGGHLLRETYGKDALEWQRTFEPFET